MRIADVVAVHMREEDGVDLAEPRVAGAAHGAPRVVENARAVRILEDDRAVERAELAVVAAERRDLDGLGKRWRSREREQIDERAHAFLRGITSGRCRTA